jgi:tetratricopeptide (TPR) repeat protein
MSEAQVWHNYGQLFLMQGELELSKKHSGLALRIDPEYTKAKMGLVQIELELGNTEASIELLSECIKELEQKGRINEWRAMVKQVVDTLEGEERYNDAREVCEEAADKATSIGNDMDARVFIQKAESIEQDSDTR